MVMMTAPPPTKTPSRESRIVTFPDWERMRFTPKQAEIINCDSDLILLNCGRFMGKDHILALMATIKMFELFGERDGNPEWSRVGEVVSVIVLAPTEKNFRDLWGRFIESLPPIPGIAPDGNPNIHVRHDAREISIFGGRIMVYFETTTQPQNLRGRGCDILVITEMAYQSKEAIVDVVLPTCIRAGYAGIVLANSSPKGAGHWFDAECSELKRGEGYFYDLGFAYFEGDLFDNPKVTIKEIGALRALLKANPFVARREMLAWTNQPVTRDFMLGAGESLAFDADQWMKCKLTSPVMTSGPFRIGIDLATGGDDHLAVVVIDGNGIVIKIERHAKTSLPEIIQIILRINKQFRPIGIWYDANMNVLKGAHIKTGQLAVVPLKPLNMSNQLKVQMVENLQMHILNRSIRVPDPELYYRRVKPPSRFMQENLYRLDNELLSYVKFTLRRDRQYRGQVIQETSVVYHKSSSGTDDILDALSMAASEHPIPYVIQTLQQVRSDEEAEAAASPSPAANNNNRKGGIFSMGKRPQRKKLF